MQEFVIELWAFLRERKKFWLLPIIAILCPVQQSAGAHAGISSGAVHLHAVLKRQSAR